MLLVPALALAAKTEGPGVDLMALLSQLAIHPLMDAYEATVGLGSDFVKYTMATPQAVADFYVYMVGLLRATPDFAKNIYEGDAASMDKVATFCVGTAASIFVVYAGIAALNLLGEPFGVTQRPRPEQPNAQPVGGARSSHARPAHRKPIAPAQSHREPAHAP